MRKLVKFPLYGLLAVAALLIAVLGYLTIALPDVGAPPDLRVPDTPDYIERGRYLSYHVMMCADCHSVRDFTLFSAPPTPGTEFAGGDVFDHSMGLPGRFVSPNITPAGVGDWTDGELFRLITTGVKRDGNPIFPVMPYHNFGRIDAEDIKAVIAYLRTLEPVESQHPASKADFPVNFIMRTMPKKAEPTPRPSPVNTIAYGEYIFTAAACGDCHTRMEKGKFTGPLGGGGRMFILPDGSTIYTPNLTPHKTGLNKFTRESFIERFKIYSDGSYTLPQVAPGEFQTLMPWAMYSGMTREDLGAIFDFLQTLEPYDNHVEAYVSSGE